MISAVTAAAHEGSLGPEGDFLNLAIEKIVEVSADQQILILRAARITTCLL